MNFDADKKTISTLLNCKKEFKIPRFQREYSWEKPQLKEFFEDIISRISVDADGNLSTTEYFWGTTLFVGSFTDSSCKSLLVVDGQQRLTTITIFLSCIRKAFLKIGNTKLAEITQSYVMSMDDNGDPYKILVNETPYPYFQNMVQAENASETVAVTEEEKNIKDAVDYFNSCLKKDKLTKYLKERFGTAHTFETSNVYKALRDQLLNSVIIAVSTQDKHQANMIFEILNAKGKSLDQLDLIKNQIFAVINREEPSDEAKVCWKQIKDILYSRSTGVDFSVFFNHYWTSKYHRTIYKRLYSNFKSTIKKTEQSYFAFLKDLKENAEYYVRITNPSLDDFEHRIEYRNVYVYLNFLNDINIRQSRILILSLFYLLHQDPKPLSAADFNNALRNLSVYHLIFNGLYAQGTNTLESLYAKAAIELRTMRDKADVKARLKKLYAEMGKTLSKVVVNRDLFLQKFEDLRYFGKVNVSDNIKSKFFIRILYELQAAYPADCSLEHIMNESAERPESVSVGNIIPLEVAVNNRIPQSADFSEKVNRYYVDSNYPVMEDFVAKHRGETTWDAEAIRARTAELAKTFVEKCLTDFDLSLS